MVDSGGGIWSDGYRRRGFGVMDSKEAVLYGVMDSEGGASE